jgi:glutaredoxin
MPSYQSALDRFARLNTQVLGISVDSVPCLKAWAESLGGITYPLLSDFYPHGQVAQMYGVLRAEGYSERALFVVDKQGVIRYVDVHKIDEQPDNEELFRVLEQLEPHAAAMSAPALAPEPAPAPTPTADVVLYCTSWCPACRRAREFLKKHNIAYVEIDIGRDRAAAARVRQWANGNETTPTFDIRGTIIVNFDQDKLERVLGLKH